MKLATKRTGALNGVINNLVNTSFTNTPDAFTEDDYLIIDFVNENNTKDYGDFRRKIKGRVACWELTYRIRTIPYVYFSTEEVKEQTVRTLDTEYDEVELHYVHQSYCDHSQLNLIIKDILINYLDPKTYLLAAQVKVQPINLADFQKTYGGFKKPFTTGDNYEINYWYSPDKYENWDLVDRPLTSSPVPLKNGKHNEQ